MNKPARFRLLRSEAITGNQTNGDPWQLYPVKNEHGNELSFFAPNDVHAVIVEHKLKAGDEFILTRVENGKKGSSKLQVSIVGRATESENTSTLEDDGFEHLMLKCVKDARFVADNSGIQFSNDELQKIATTLFIKRSR